MTNTTPVTPFEAALRDFGYKCYELGKARDWLLAATPAHEACIAIVRTMDAEIKALKAENEALKARLPEDVDEEKETPLTPAELKFLRGLQKWEWIMVYYTDVNRCDIANRLELRGLVQIDHAPTTYMNVTLPSAKGE